MLLQVVTLLDMELQTDYRAPVKHTIVVLGATVDAAWTEGIFLRTLCSLMGYGKTEWTSSHVLDELTSLSKRLRFELLASPCQVSRCWMDQTEVTRSTIARCIISQVIHSL